MKYYTVIDTNVLVSSMLTSDKQSSIARIIDAIRNDIIQPMYNDAILDEYLTVLNRPRFGFSKYRIEDLISMIRNKGFNCDRKPVSEFFPDPDDIVFYEVAMSRDDSYLVTGNLKHFPQNGRVVSPAEMLYIIEHAENNPHYLSDSEFGYYLSIPLEEINAIIREVRDEKVTSIR